MFSKGAQGANGIVTVPNIISLLRLFSVPLVLWFLLEENFVVAFWLFLLASISDGIDGFIAKRFNARSIIGSYLDPIADKALLLGVYIALGVAGHLPVWLVALVVFRDVMIVGGAALFLGMTGKLEVQPLLSGKLNTLAQILLAGAALAAPALQIPIGALIEGLVYFVMATVLFSGACYLVTWSWLAGELEE